MVWFDGGYNPGEVSHTVLLELRRTAERHPVVQHARGAPPGQYTRVVAELDPSILGRDAAGGTLTIRRYAGETPEDPPEFAFHYSESSGFDCGWYHEPNEHVDGWAHYQERPTASMDYEYERTSFGSLQPVPLFWELFDRLEDRHAER